MADPFTIRIFVPEGDPEGVRIIDRLSSTGIFFAFPRIKWDQIKNRQELSQAGIYILSGYADPEHELPTIYVGQADVVKLRMDQHIKNAGFKREVQHLTGILPPGFESEGLVWVDD